MAEEKTHNWTPEETEALIQWRSDNEFFFTGKRNSSICGWEHFVAASGFDVTAKQAKKKWNNLKAKYKELSDLPKGNGVEAGSVTAATWQWYGIMDAVLQGKHPVSPPLKHDIMDAVLQGKHPVSPPLKHDIMDAVLQGKHPVSPPLDVAANLTATAASTSDGATASRPPRKRARDNDAVLQFLKAQAERERETLARAEERGRDCEAILQFLKDQAEKEEERERRALARDEERERAVEARAERYLSLFEKLVNKM